MKEDHRRVAAAAGVVALAGAAVVLAGASGQAPSSPIGALSVAGGVLAAAMAYVAYRDWVPSGGIEIPEVERSIRHPTPGDEVDRTLAQFGGPGRDILTDRNAIHDRLCELAAKILARRRGCPLEEARATVERGDWPDDTAVAAFLRNRNVKLPRSWRDRARELVGDETGPSDFQVLVRRTIDALASRSELVDVDDDSDVAGFDGAPVGGTTTGRSDAAAEAMATDGTGRVLETVTTGRWQAVVPVALAFVGFGIAVRRAAVVLAGVVAIGYAVYARAFAPQSASLSVERSIDADRPAPGDDVEVTTTVRNEGADAILDLRIVDGVPSGLSVSEGSPRHGTALRPGESTSFTYSVTPRRGHHEFGSARAIVRDLAGTTGRVTLEPTAPGSDGSIDCVLAVDGLPVPVPLYEQSGQYLGRIPADGGEGVAFHAVREYRPGDPSTRIDWKRLARSAEDELTTVQYREERAATVAVVIDAHPDAYLAPGPDDPGAVERSIEAAGRLVRSLLGAGDRVGIAALGPTPLWLQPDAGIDHRERVEELLATHPAFPPTAPAAADVSAYWSREFHRRFPSETQVVLLSPLCTYRNRFVIRRLRAYGHPVTVVSPDPTADETVGQRLVRVERRQHLEALRESGIRVVDWDPAEDLAVAMGRAATRWSG